MSQNTTFVIGAGASKEAGLPTGHELKTTISKLLDIRFEHWNQISGDKSIKSSLDYIVKNGDENLDSINPYLHEAWHIRDALPLAISIDNFIDSQRNNKKIAICGKLAITKAILEAERASKLYFKPTGTQPEINLSSLEQTWYLPFFQLLTENCIKSDLEQRFGSVSLIIFNYDRCFEHFIFNALQKYYSISSNEAASLVGVLNIYHPYGSVGNLPWQEQENRIGFGETPNAEMLAKLSTKIRTFTEGTDPNESEILAIRDKMRNTQRVVFIGFAFHKLNMQLISPDGHDLQEAPKCYATTLGVSTSDQGVVRNQINALYKDQISINMANLQCSEFFTEFWRSLSFQ
jgi:hypothetical protein